MRESETFEGLGASEKFESFFGGKGGLITADFALVSFGCDALEYVKAHRLAAELP